MKTLHSFDPIIQNGCSLLILGSMPGVVSLQQQQYYAHPRNAFWSIIAALYGIEREQDYSERCERLTGCGLALWDVLEACQREGSLDSKIKPATEQANDFSSLFSKHDTIKYVLFNGRAAEQLYKKHVLSVDEVDHEKFTLIRLPSTSPAYAAMSFEKKLEMWEKALAL